MVWRPCALAIPLEGDGYEAESRHLKTTLERDLTVAWVPIPAIYEGEQKLVPSVSRLGTRPRSAPTAGRTSTPSRG